MKTCKTFLMRSRVAATTIVLACLSTGALADAAAPVLLKIVTVKDEIIVAVAPGEANAPRPDAASVGQAMAAKGAVTFWQYTTRKAADGALEWAPRAKISVLAHDSLRVEPYTPAVRVLPLKQ
jgi:hypothetical protein